MIEVFTDCIEVLPPLKLTTNLAGLVALGVAIPETLTSILLNNNL